MRALIYCRASSDPKMRLRSVGDQEQDCRDWCEREGWQIVGVIVDANRSATRWAKREREGWTAVMDRLADVDVLVMWEASRAARQMEGFVELRSALQDTDTLLAYSGRIWDLSRGDDVFAASLDALLAEREASSIRDRIVRTVRLRAERGKPAGRTPFGYRRRYNPDTGELVDQVIDEVTGPLVREMVSRVLAGEATSSIAADLQRRGVPTPGGDEWWKSRTVKRAVETPSIAGLRVHQGKVVGPATWPAIVSAETHDRVLAMLERAPRSGGAGVKHLLGHIARCGGCGRFLETQGRTGRKTYECRNPACPAKASVLAELADEFVMTYMEGWLGAQDIGPLGNDPQPDFQAVRDDLRGLYDRLSEAGRAYAEGSLSLTALQSAESVLQPRIADLEQQLKPKADDPLVSRIAAADDPVKVWKSAPLPEQRGAIRALLDIRVYRATRRGVFNPDRIRIERL